jgi:glutamyl-tRNA synthetase/glutamyl-Q tRNA(Asp) synthetase
MLRTRFAPAPTGYLHLGHVVNALYVWDAVDASGRQRGGGAREGASRSREVLLRIEDHDRQRSRPEYERAILEDLDWLGFVPDATVERQSARGHEYEAALDSLRAQGLVYACECSRAELVPGTEQSERRYPGTCAGKRLPERQGLSLRVRLAPRAERFVDLRLGPQEQRPSEQCGDLLVRDRDGNWTYQFCAVVDDLNQGITLIVRGEDLLPSTGRQIQLGRLLGRSEPPGFLHHPLVMKSATQKLSKSDGDTGVRDLRARGWTAAQVREHAIGLAGARAEPGVE